MQSINNSVTICSGKFYRKGGYFVEDKKKNIIVRVDDKLGKEIKVLVAQEGTTQQDYIVNLILKDLEERKEVVNK